MVSPSFSPGLLSLCLSEFDLGDTFGSCELAGRLDSQCVSEDFLTQL